MEFDCIADHCLVIYIVIAIQPLYFSCILVLTGALVRTKNVVSIKDVLVNYKPFSETQPLIVELMACPTIPILLLHIYKCKRVQVPTDTQNETKLNPL